MKASQRLKVSLLVIWLSLTSVSVAAFFIAFEEYERLIEAYHHIEPLDFNWREETLAQSIHTSYLFQLENGRYDLRFYHFEEGQRLNSGYLVRELSVKDAMELLISSQVLGERIQWRLDFYGSNLEPFLWTDYLEDRQAFIGSGALEEGMILEDGKPQVLFYFAHWSNRAFAPVTLEFLSETLSDEDEAPHQFAELSIITITRLGATDEGLASIQ